MVDRPHTPEIRVRRLLDFQGCPGQKLIGWAPLVAALIIALNDFWLKRAHPGWLSGKLSDFGICFFLPVWLYSLLEVALWLKVKLVSRGHKKWQARPRPALAAFSCLVAGAYFTGLQISAPFARMHIDILETLFAHPFVVTPDPSDLVALIFLPLAWWYLVGDSTAASP